MPTIRRSAVVERPAAYMFDLVNDVQAYPRRFDWCDGATVLESGPQRLVARLDLGLGALRTWFTTDNALQPPQRIDMRLVDGPFRKLHGIWQFQSLGQDGQACKVSLTLEFEPASRLLAPAFALGFQGLADRMVDDFVRVANQGR
ncbi:MAG: type II toxin-antitoxin system RatA family toxin [Pseudoxanthomonas sp.]